jgi:hypothetical protein
MYNLYSYIDKNLQHECPGSKSANSYMPKNVAVCILEKELLQISQSCCYASNMREAPLNILVHSLTVLTNEKRGGLSLVSFDWSRFKLFTLKFSKESVQIPSCERPKTAQRTLFLSFEINNCYPITV